MCVNLCNGLREGDQHAPSLGLPIWGHHLRQQLQQGPVRTAATELAQASEEGSGLGGTWVEKQSIDLEGGSQPRAYPTPTFPCPTTQDPCPATHPQKYLKAAGRLWGSPAGLHSGSAP